MRLFNGLMLLYQMSLFRKVDVSQVSPGIMSSTVRKNHIGEEKYLYNDR